ncbi:MAG: SBBP repeat-containing protein [Acidobacteriota bacterium]
MKSFHQSSYSADPPKLITLRRNRFDLTETRSTRIGHKILSPFSARHSGKAKVAAGLIMGLALITMLALMFPPLMPDRNTFAAGLSASEATGSKSLLTDTSARTASNQQKFREAYAQSQLSFEANQDQAKGELGFLARGRGYGIFLTPSETVFVLHQPGTGFSTRTKEHWTTATSPRTMKSRPTILTMKLIGANPASKGSGLDVLPSRSNYFIGNDPKQWRTNITQYSKVQYEEIYPGINLIYYGNQRQLEYDFVLSPGADPRQIKMAFEGAQKVVIAENGELVVRTAQGEMRQHRPFIYQMINGARREIAGRYVLSGKREAGISVDEYDRTQPLTIDPILIYSTFLGGTSDDFGNGIEADAAGNVYVTGLTYSADFPAKNALQISLRGFGNAFVAKFNPSGGLIYNTFLGGSSEDVGFAITVDAQGGTYIAGSTDSSNFPVTSNAFQAQRRGRIDAFVTKLNATGNVLEYSTFVGGQGDSLANSIAVDASRNAYVVGETTSSSFPSQSAFQSSMSGPSDAFVIKLNPSGGGLVYATYLGGNGHETAFGVAVDSAGSAYVTGLVYSLNFPTRNPAQTSLGGRVDMFVTKLNPAGNDLVYSTYLGGFGDDGGFGIGIDGAGNAYVSGFTTSTNFPTKNAFQTSSGGGDDAVFLKLDQAGKLLFSSYLGGAGEDRSFDLVVDNNSNFYLVGRTESANFPVKDALQPLPGGQQLQSSPDLALPVSSSQLSHRGTWTDHGNRDADRWKTMDGQARRGDGPASLTSAVVHDGFVAKVNTNGQLIYSTYLGGIDEDKVFAVAVDNASNAYVTGITASGNFPIKGNVQRALGGVTDAFIAKISDGGNTQASVSAASFVRGPLAAEEIIASFGADLADATQIATTVPLPTSLGTTNVKVIDSAGVERQAPLFYVSPTQINYLIPLGTADGLARVLTIRSGVVISAETTQINKVAPSIFSANSNGKGVIAGLALRVKTTGEQTYEAVIRFDAAQGMFAPIPVNLGPETDQIYLVIFGTGFRNRSSLGNINATIGGTPVSATFAGAQGQLVGLDQLNLLIPRSLAGRGEMNIVIVIDGQVANTTLVNIK